eukprot:scaffold18788_cov19-Tisochrysis_lutea.AAC.1
MPPKCPPMTWTHANIVSMPAKPSPVKPVCSQAFCCLKLGHQGQAKPSQAKPACQQSPPFIRTHANKASMPAKPGFSRLTLHSLSGCTPAGSLIDDYAIDEDYRNNLGCIYTLRVESGHMQWWIGSQVLLGHQSKRMSARLVAAHASGLLPWPLRQSGAYGSDACLWKYVFERCIPGSGIEGYVYASALHASGLAVGFT